MDPRRSHFGIAACLALTTVRENSYKFYRFPLSFSENLRPFPNPSVGHTAPTIVTQTPLREMETLSLETHDSPHTAIPDLIPENIGKPCFHQWDHTLTNGESRFCSIHGVQEYPAQMEARWMHASDVFSGQKDVADKLSKLLYDSDQTNVTNGTRCEECTVEIGDLIQQVIKKDTYQQEEVFLIRWKPLYMFKSAGLYPVFEYDGTLRQRQELKKTSGRQHFVRILPAEDGIAPNGSSGSKLMSPAGEVEDAQRSARSQRDGEVWILRWCRR